LGNIGAGAGKPVMEGKGVLFKRFADIDVFDIEIASEDPKDVIRTCQLLEPTFGGINLEDIKAPECFEIEEELRRTMKIPVFHDDQHGTAIISGAALLNALEITGKRIEEIRVVVNGAGASAIACTDHWMRLGVRRENILMCDTKGVIYAGRKDGMNKYKERFAHETPCRTLADALVGADVFLGLSVANCVTQEMVRSMAPNPVVFALANPTPEISYEEAKAARSDVIIATGRSDYPNQVNNVLGFPAIFRGALDTRAMAINDEMKLAATRALAALAKEDVPDSVCRVYGVERLQFGREYLIPKPFDPRVMIVEAAAVAKAAMDTGVARLHLDLEEYHDQLERRLGAVQGVVRTLLRQARQAPVKVVFPEGEEPKILRAAQILADEGAARPVLIGNRQRIEARIQELRLHPHDLDIVEPGYHPDHAAYAEQLYRLRQRRGVTRKEADELARQGNVLGSLMVAAGHAGALITGLTSHYPDALRPLLRIVSMKPGIQKASGLYIAINNRGQLFFLADCTVNFDPDAEELAEIAICTADTARRFHVEPRVAMLSFSNFGSVRHPSADKVRRAVELVRQRESGLMIDGEMQADTAVVPDIIAETYPFSTLKGGANVLIFPNLDAGNIAYKLLARLGGLQLIGPILQGPCRPVHVLQRGATVDDIVNVAALAVVEAQNGAALKAIEHVAELASA
jgi:malate dehydrogenase (oxaloacetate-decarboxylating)(NADP+)